MRYFYLIFAAMLLAANTSCAASFDCAKASSKVEKMICADPELSKRDSELGSSYSTALKTVSNPFELRLQQREWIKERNLCDNEDCLKSVYQKRIDEIATIIKKKKVAPLFAADQTYALVMSKNDKMCNYMRNLMEADLHQFNRVYDDGYRFVSTNDVFSAVPWKPTRASLGYSGNKPPYTEDGQLEGALFDLNNDGVLDYVIRDKSMLSGRVVDGIYMFDRNMANRANHLTTTELFEADNQLSMNQVRYPLALESGRETVSLWLLSPFIYQGVSYVYMQSLYEIVNQTAIGDFVVIAKYFGGKFKRQSTGRMEDICYIKRVAVDR